VYLRLYRHGCIEPYMHGCIRHNCFQGLYRRSNEASQKETHMQGFARQWSSQRRTPLRLLAVALMVSAFLFGFGSFMLPAQAASMGGWVTIPGHMVPALKGIAPLRSSATNRQLQLAISLKLRNTAQLNELLLEQADPHSSLYHQYLTPQQFTAMFGPTQASVDQMVSYLNSEGLHVSSVSSNRLLIDASGSLATIERAFNTSIADYTLKGRSVFAPTREPAMPAALAGLVLNISGLDNVAQYRH